MLRQETPRNHNTHVVIRYVPILVALPHDDEKCLGKRDVNKKNWIDD